MGAQHSLRGAVMKPTSTSTFDPLTLSPTMWVKADQIAGKADGDAVSQWDDLSGNARHLTQATGGAQPLYKTGIVNGKPVVRFDGVDDKLETAAFAPSLPLTQVVVGVWRSTYNSSKRPLITGNSSFNGYLHRTSATAVSVYSGSTINFTTTPQTWHIYLAMYPAAGSGELYVDGGTPVTGSVGTGTWGGVALAGGPGDFGDVDVAEALVIPGSLSAPNRASLLSYLGTKYGIAVT